MPFVTNRRSAFPHLKKETSVSSGSTERPKTPEDINALPLDSEDESESQQSAPHVSDTDSSDGSAAPRQNITRTVFKKGRPGPAGKTAKSSKDAKNLKRHHEDDDQTSRSDAQTKGRSVSPSKDEDDAFLRRMQQRDRKSNTNKFGYGKAPDKAAAGRNLKSKDKAKTTHQEKQTASSRGPRLRALSPVPGGSGKSPLPPSLKRPEPLPSSPAAAEEATASLRIPGSLENSPVKRRGKKRLKKDKKDKKNDVESELSEAAAPMFRIPGMIPGDDEIEPPAAPKSLNVPPQDVDFVTSMANADVTEASDIESASAPESEATCPFCDDAVDADLLRNYARGRQLTIRQQMKFCDLHKKNSAEAAWKTKGYPSIDWEHLDDRLDRHQKPIKRIIAGADSYYKSILSEKLATGQERTLKQTDRSLAPGYYGNRGLRLMSEYIIRYFNEMLREKAVDDPVISGRGTTVFVSTVLVPELATRLIMEDMSVSLVRAREILADSIDVGDLLHEDVGDDVRAPLEAEDSQFGRDLRSNSPFSLP